MTTRFIKRRNERGATLVEAAFVLPVFLLVLFGLIDIGVAIGVKQVVTHAAAEGARAAIGAQINTAVDSSGNNGSNQQYNAYDRVAAAQALSASSSFGGTLGTYNGQQTPFVAACSGDATHQCITVVVNATSPVNIPIFGILVPTSQTQTAIVQVQ